MGNVIPWSQIHPTIKTEEPFIAVVVVDPHRKLCVSEVIDLEAEQLADPDVSSGELIAAAQSAAAKVAAGYRLRRRAEPAQEPGISAGRLQLLQGGLTKER